MNIQIVKVNGEYAVVETLPQCGFYTHGYFDRHGDAVFLAERLRKMGVRS